MINIDNLSEEEFKQLPLVVEGESKEIRNAGLDEVSNPICVIKLKPTIYSFTHNRCGIVPGTDKLRLRAIKSFLKVLKENEIDHTYRQVNDNYILSDLINPPNIEVIVKAFHTGTSKHRYYGMDTTPVRQSHPLYSGFPFKKEDAYPVPFVRFDWRNPMYHPESNKRLADECLGDSQADWFIDVKEARLTALKAFMKISDYLATKDIIMSDVCFFITEDGKRLFGEISQDCGRFRHFNLGSLDKDVWRAGKSDEVVVKQWKLLADLLED